MNLTSLGIPPLAQAKGPTIDTFPLAFNPNQEDLWPIALGAAKSKNPRQAWMQAVERFVELCRQKAVFAFHQHETDNDKIITRLLEARREIVRFIDQNKVLDELSTYKVQRIVRMTNTGFQLTVDVHARRITEDPTFMNRLSLRQVNSRYTRNLRDNITFFVYNEGADLSQRWHFGYDIEINIFPNVPGKPLATTQEQERFVLDVMYLPLLRAYRPLNSIQRLI